tara:strand:+ start:224 stop:613 length:390 start_codon:yes stop_codon:yes gene_type:complete
MKKAIKHDIRTEGGIGDSIKDIIEAAINGDAPLVKEILEQGGDINTIEPERGFTCLHIACQNGDNDVADVLFEHNSRFHDLDFTIQTFDPPRLAWQLAMSAHHYDLANRVDVAARGEAGSKPSGPKLVR